MKSQPDNALGEPTEAVAPMPLPEVPHLTEEVC